MAPRKRPGMILKRDHAFTQTIGTPGSRAPNAFSMAAEDAKAKLEAAQASGDDRSAGLPVNTALVLSSAEVVLQAGGASRMDQLEAPDSEQHEKQPAAAQIPPIVSPKVASSERRLPRGGSDVPPRPQRNAITEDPGEQIELIISMTVSQDLLERAAQWGAVAHQPPTTVLRHALKKIKPQLLEDLRTLQIHDVHQQRTRNVGYRLQSRLRFGAAEFASLEARLDPAGFGVLSSMLNHYARDSFARFLDKFMAEAGY